jgi:selenide,water dikinase
MGLPRSEVVLLGVGHTNAHVLRMGQMHPLPQTRMTCVSNFPIVTYSGMLPGVLAGQYPQERMEIDLVRRCAAAGARLIVGQVTGLDLPGQRLLFADRPSLPFDVLSIGIGSNPTQEGVCIEGDLVLPIKPMQTFLARLEQRLAERKTKGGTQPLRVIIVGGGAGGVEIAFCLPARLKTALGDAPWELTLVNAHTQVAGGMAPKTIARIQQKLEDRGVRLVLGRRVVRIAGNEITLDDGQRLAADLVLWATSAVAPSLLGKLGLPTDNEGFLLTHDTLQSTSGAPIFAVGDSGSIQDQPLPKAGVYAVRQGPVLWENIQRMLQGRPLEPYRPQRGFMKLLNTGDGCSLGDWKGATFEGRWVWRLKDRIDGRFMDKHQDYRPMPQDAKAEKSNAPPVMRCAGCGGKVGGTVLARVLRRLDVPTSECVLLGLNTPDDAAVIQLPASRTMAATTDFFTAPLDDAYTAGRIAALHAASDVFAMGARPVAALAIATIPLGDTQRQEDLLYELLAGGVSELRSMGATLAGGHTIEGLQTVVGFTLLADPGESPPRTKGPLKVGDQLVLTKPLGTGVLLAAHQQAACRAEWMTELLHTMLESNQGPAALLPEFAIEAVTDITGFGLAGHLLEMLHATNGRPWGDSDSPATFASRDVLAVELELAAVPLLPGAAELLASGIESTLAPANRDAEAEIDAPPAMRRTPQYAALFDPQTSGGLLLAVPERHCTQVLKRLREQSNLPAAVVGRVVASHGDQPRVKVVG